jgi:hypothetical protein
MVNATLRHRTFVAEVRSARFRRPWRKITYDKTHRRYPELLEV